MARLRCLIIATTLAVIILGCNENGPEQVPSVRYITSFGTWGTDDGEFKNPRSIAVGPDSLLYVGDVGNRRIQVFTEHGKFVRQWPVDSDISWSWIVVAPNGNVYVDLDYRTIGEYTNTGQFLGTLDFVDADDGFEIDASGNFYIYGRIYGSDPGPYVWKFSPERELIKKWGYSGTQDSTGWSGGPMTWNTRGNLLILGAMDSTAAVFEFTPDGESVSAWRITTLEAHITEDIACDHLGRILITTPYRKSVVFMFDSEGRLLTEWNQVSESHEPLKSPAGIAVDAIGFLYVVDYGRFRVVKYEVSP